MSWLRMGVLVCLLVVLSAGFAQAGDQDKTTTKEKKYPVAWGGMGATFGPGGMGVPAGTLGIGGNLVYGQSDNVRIGNRSSNDSSKTTKFNQIFKTRYGIMDGLDIRTATPFYNTHLSNQYTPNRDVYGIGDTAVVLHKRLLNQLKGDPFSVAIDLGGVLPTGSVDAHSADAAGNSAWGFITGLGATYFYGANRFDAEVNYATFTMGAKNYEKGDRGRFNFAYAYALNNYLDLGVESQWEWNAQSQYLGNNQHNASSEWYVGPKLVFKYMPWKTFLGVEATMPVVRWYESSKVGSDDFRIEVKLIKLFNIGSLF